MQRWMTAVGEQVRRHRDLIGRFAFEFVIIVVGVTVAFGIEAARQRASEAAYRQEMIAALIPIVDDVMQHGEAFEREAAKKLTAFDAALARGGRPQIPVFREDNSERPPTRAWEAVVQTGAVRALKPAMFYKLTLFYTRQESFGERYIRYNDFTEQRVFTLAAAGEAYDAAGRPKPEFRAHVDRLRDLLALSRKLTAEAKEIKVALAKAG